MSDQRSWNFNHFIKPTYYFMNLENNPRLNRIYEPIYLTIISTFSLLRHRYCTCYFVQFFFFPSIFSGITIQRNLVHDPQLLLKCSFAFFYTILILLQLVNFTLLWSSSLILLTVSECDWCLTTSDQYFSERKLHLGQMIMMMMIPALN